MAAGERLPWHESSWHQVCQRRSAGRLPHALILTGIAGLGKGQFAERLADALLCATPTRDGDACSHCAPCKLLRAGTHPDMRRVTPEEPRKAIRIDAVRELISYLTLKSQYSGYKVAIVSPADRMNAAAANALLKTLEEPTAQTLLILVSARPSVLPATIRSRCQVIAFGVPERAQALGWLRQQGVESAETALDVAGGAPLKALQVATSDDLSLRSQLAEDLGRLANNRVDPVALAARYSQSEVRSICSWLLSYVTDMIRLAMVPNPPGLRNSDVQGGLARLAADIRPAELFLFQDALLNAQWMSDTQINAQLLMEDLFVRWSRLKPR